MSNDNYPAGVTDAHPYFNPDERPVNVTCGWDEVLVMPAFSVKQSLNDLQEFVTRLAKLNPKDAEMLGSISYRINMEREALEGLEKDGTYECGWEGEQELPTSEEAEWDCPRCGTTQTTDTIPEERDPDEGWDSRYDD